MGTLCPTRFSAGLTASRNAGWPVANPKALQSHFYGELLNPGQLIAPPPKPSTLPLWVFSFFSFFSPCLVILISPRTNCCTLRSIAPGRDRGWSRGRPFSCSCRGISSFLPQIHSNQASSTLLLYESSLLQEPELAPSQDDQNEISG